MREKPVFVFDLGRVLVDFPDMNESIARNASGLLALERLEEHCTVEQFLAAVRFDEFSKGRLDDTREPFTEAMFLALNRKFLAAYARPGSSISDDAINELWINVGFEADVPMLMLAGYLKGAGYQCFILSNTIEPHKTFIKRRFDYTGYFAEEFYSCDLGMIKPDAAIYRFVEDRIRQRHRGGELQAGSIVYIDDLPENTAAARQAGWTAILHKDPAETIPRIMSII